MRLVRTAVAVALLSGIVLLPTPAAQADLSTGACLLYLTWGFTPDVGLVSGPDSTVGGSGLCGNAIGPVLGGDLLTSTDVSGSADSIVWTCEAAEAIGSWGQSFGTGGPPAFSGTFALGGTWGEWSLAVLAPNAVATGTFTTLEPLDGAACATGGIDSIDMTGVLVFQDP